MLDHLKSRRIKDDTAYDIKQWKTIETEIGGYNFASFFVRLTVFFPHQNIIFYPSIGINYCLLGNSLLFLLTKVTNCGNW
jgi:hypothetical protein